MAFALKNTAESQRRGRDVWFRFQTVIGPCATEKTSERALFKSSDAAMQTSAFRHPLCSYEPVEVEPKEGGDFDWNEGDAEALAEIPAAPTQTARDGGES